MKFKPDGEIEREAFELQPPRFDLEQDVQTIDTLHRGKVTEIFLRIADPPVWGYVLNNHSAWYFERELEEIFQ